MLNQFHVNHANPQIQAYTLNNFFLEEMGFPIDSSTTHFSLDLLATCCQVPASAIVSKVTNCRCFEKRHDIFIFTPNQESAKKSASYGIFCCCNFHVALPIGEGKIHAKKMGLRCPVPSFLHPAGCTPFFDGTL